jgi:autotransporter-associated beta strand protein
MGGINAMGSGALTINGGTIAANATRNVTARYTSVTIGGDFTIGAVTANVTSGNGSAAANITFADNMGLGAATRTITIGSNATYSFNGIFSGSTGTGLTINASPGATGNITLGGNNSFNGPFSANGGITNLSVNGALGAVSSVTIASGATVRTSVLGLTNAINDSAAVTVNGTLDVSGGTETVASLAGTNTGAFLTIGKSGATTGSFTVGDANSTSFAGVIQDGAAGGGTTTFTKQGAGTLTLTNANTYSGATAVTAGTLLVNNTTGSGTGTSSVTVNGSGTTLGGTGAISGSVSVSNTAAGAIVNPGPKGTAGTSGSVGTLTVGSLTLSATNASTIHIDAFGTGTNEWDKLISTGAIALNTLGTLDVTIASGLTFTPGSTYTLLSGSSLSGTFAGITDGQTVTFSGYSFTADYTPTGFDLLVPVPEPSTWIGAALALAAVGFTQRRKLRGLIARRA